MSWRPRTDGERAAFRDGFRDLIPVGPGTFAWGLVTGVAMVKSGLTLAQAVGMTVLVFAGSAQLSALPLIAAASPVWVIVLTALVVNLRFVIYAAAMRNEFKQHSHHRRLWLGYFTGDVGFVIFMEKLKRDGSFPHKDWYFLGGSAANWVFWQIGSLIGIFAAAFIPTAWGLELAGMLALLALMIPLCSTRPALIGTIVASIVAVLTYHFPMKLGLPIAVACGITAAILSEPRRPRAVAPREAA